MNRLEKFRYLGPAQTFRKYFLKTERVLKRFRRPPALPVPDKFDVHVTLLGHEFDLAASNRWHSGWPVIYSQAIPLDAGGDVKLIWELNRLQFLAGLDREFAHRLLRDWIAQNPPEFGINWRDPMEVALRLIACLEIFGREPFLETHARFIRHNLTCDAIPRNNHLIAETAALSFYDGKPHRWLRQAAVEQFYKSGIDREQSVAYHRFVTHLFEIASLPQPKAFAYLGAIRQPDGSLPDIGDNDDGRASIRPLELPAAPTGSVAFSDAGHYVMRHGGNYCFIRCGEFGLPPNFAHGHADLMSPVIWLRGEPVFVDTGTFTYNGDPKLRRYFRSAQAHNVLTIDDQDMAEQAGTFAWKNPPRGICEKWTGTEFVGSVRNWRRRILYEGGRFIITDNAPAGRLRWRFHLHPNLKITRCGNGEFVFGNFTLKSPGNLRVGEGWLSPSYGRRLPIEVCEISMDATSPVTAEFELR
jgi:hypothetical protein